MALFFDQAWFDGRLAEQGLSRGDIARALGLPLEQIEEIWKDQRELSARDVASLAHCLGVPAAEIAHKAGVSTPVPKDRRAGMDQIDAKLDAILERLERIEGELRALKIDRAMRDQGAWPAAGPAASES